MYKILLIIISNYFLAAASITMAEPSVSKLWQTNAQLKIPESVLFDVERRVLYVSNIDSDPDDFKPWFDDGKGSIAKVGLDGKIIDAEWVKDLNAPKGMGINGNYLYVTDNDDIVTIDIESGKVVDRYSVPNADKINDLSVGDDGTIYITDSGQGKIHKLVNAKLTTLITGLSALNGVLHSQGELLYVSNGALYLVDKKYRSRKIAGGMEGRVDGVERVDDNSWLVSCWEGTVYHVTRTGRVTLLLDGRAEQISAADLGYDPISRVAFFPGFFKNYVTAYKLNAK